MIPQYEDMVMKSNVSLREEPSDTAARCVLAEIRRRLCSTGYPSLREIHCDFSEGVVVLRGRVSRYFYKQLAQAVLLAEPAVWMVVNQIEVSEDGHRDR